MGAEARGDNGKPSTCVAQIEHDEDTAEERVPLDNLAEKGTEKSADSQSERPNIGLLVIFFSFNVILPLADIITDTFTGVGLIQKGHVNWGIATLLLPLAPMVARFVVIIFGKRGRIAKADVADILVFSPFMPFRNFIIFLDFFRTLETHKIMKRLFMVSRLCLYEAFLEAAPQAVLQFSIILRIGYIAGPMQFLSIISSIFSLTFASAKAFYSQRLIYYADPDPTLLDFVFPLLPLYFVVIVPNLLAWTVVLAYAGLLVLPMVAASVVVKYFLSRLTRKPDHTKVTEEARLYKDQEWAAILVSLISPCVVIGNDLNVLAMSSLGSVVMQALWLTATFMAAYFHLPASYDAVTEASHNPPATHCVEPPSDNAALAGVLCQWSDSAEELVNCGAEHEWMCPIGKECMSYVRICRPGESPLDVLGEAVIPSLVGCLVVSFVACMVLNWMADYKNYYRVFKKVHWNLLFDLADDTTGCEHGDALVEDIGSKLKVGKSADVVNKINVDGKTPLHIACASGNLSVVELLLGLNASSRTRDRDGMTPLAAAMAGDRADAVVALVRDEATDISWSGGGGRNPMLWACRAGHLDVVVALLKREDCEVDESLGEDQTLSVAMVGNWPRIVELLASDPRTNLDESVLQKFCPLHWAAYHGHLDVLQALLERPEVDASQPASKSMSHILDEKVLEGQTALHVASRMGQICCVRALLDCGGRELIGVADGKGHTPLLWAAAGGHVDITRLLIMAVEDLHGALIHVTPSGLNAKDLAKKLNRQKVVADLDAVEVAARRGGKARQPLIHWACKEGRMDFVAAYLERKTADTNLASPNDGMTPVMEAAKHGQVGSLTALLEHESVNVNAVDKKGNTALHYAVNEAIAERLLQRPEINVNKRNKSGLSPLHTAIEFSNRQVVEELLRRPETDANALGGDGFAPLHRACQKETGGDWIVHLLLTMRGGGGGNLDVNCRTKPQGHTPLIVAAVKGRKGIFGSLLRQPGIDLNAATASGQTALHVCATQGRADMVSSLLEMDSVDVNAVNKAGWTPMHEASFEGHEDVVRLLLKAPGIRATETTGVEGETALQLAARNGHMATMALLAEETGVKLEKPPPRVSRTGRVAGKLAFANVTQAEKDKDSV